MKFNSNFFENKSKENLIKYFILGKANTRNLIFGDNPTNCISLLHEQGKEIFKEAVSFEENNNFPIKLNEIFSELKYKSKRLMNLSAIETANGEGINIEKVKVSKTSINKKREIALQENSNSKIFKENEDLKVSNFSKFDDNNNFTCDICGCSFSNGQGLGGHMSRKHPNQSEKYQKKKQTRERRNSNREIIYKAKRILLKRFRQDYDHLINFSNGRKLIKKLVKENREEYLNIKGKIKITKNNS